MLILPTSSATSFLLNAFSSSELLLHSWNRLCTDILKNPIPFTTTYVSAVWATMYKRECCNDHIPQRTCCREVRPSLSSETQIEHASRPRSDLSNNSHTLQTKTLLLSLQAYSTAQYVYPDWELYLPEGGWALLQAFKRSLCSCGVVIDKKTASTVLAVLHL